MLIFFAGVLSISLFVIFLIYFFFRFLYSKKKIVYFLAGLSLLIVTCLTMIFIKSVYYTTYWLNTVGEVLHREMQFEYGSPYVNGEERLIITKVVPRGIMDSCGLKVGDLPSEISMPDFYKKLWEKRGDILEIEVTNVYDHPDKSQKRLLRITVPNIDDGKLDKKGK